MTNQEIFDEVATHLLKQNKTSEVFCEEKNKTVCMYRGPENTKCAFGFLITDEEYDPKMEGIAAQYLVRGEASTVFPSLHRFKDNSVIINDLQVCHDQFGPSLWKEQLRKVAKEHGLNSNALNTL